MPGRREIYDFINGEGLTSLSYSDWTAKMDTKEGRRKMYDFYKENGAVTKSYEEFSQIMTENGRKVKPSGKAEGTGVASEGKPQNTTNAGGASGTGAELNAFKSTAPDMGNGTQLPKFQGMYYVPFDMQSEDAEYRTPEEIRAEREEKLMPFNRMGDEARVNAGLRNQRMMEYANEGNVEQLTNTDWNTRMRRAEDERAEGVARKGDVGQWFDKNMSSAFADTYNNAVREAEIARRNANYNSVMSTGDYAPGHWEGEIKAEQLLDPKTMTDKLMMDARTKDSWGDLILQRIGMGGNSGDEGGESTPLTYEQKVAINNYYAKEEAESAAELQQRMYEEYKRLGAPDNVLEYIASSGFENSLIGTISDALMQKAAKSSGLRRQLLQQATAEYGEKIGKEGGLIDQLGGMTARAAASAAPLIVDSAPFAGIGAGAGLITNTAMKAIPKTIGRALMANSFKTQLGMGMLRTGLTFGGYDALTESVNQQMMNGKIDWNAVGERFLKGFGTGAAMGGLGVASGTVTKGLSGWKGGLAKAGAFGGEVTVLTGVGTIEKAIAEGKDIVDIDWGEVGQDWANNAGMIGTLKLFGTAKDYISAGSIKGMRERAKDAYKYDMALNDYDKKFLEEKYGLKFDSDADIVRSAAKLGKDNGRVAHEKGAVIEHGATIKSGRTIYQDIISDPEASVNLKRRLTYMYNGNVLSPSAMADYKYKDNGDGTYEFATVDVHNNLLDVERLNKEQLIERLNDIRNERDEASISANMNLLKTPFAYMKSSTRVFCEKNGIQEGDVSDIVVRGLLGEQLNGEEMSIYDAIVKTAAEFARDKSAAVISEAYRYVTEQTGVDVETLLSTREEEIDGQKYNVRNVNRKDMSDEEKNAVAMLRKTLDDMIRWEVKSREFENKTDNAKQIGYKAESEEDIRGIIDDAERKEKAVESEGETEGTRVTSEGEPQNTTSGEEKGSEEEAQNTTSAEIVETAEGGERKLYNAEQRLYGSELAKKAKKDIDEMLRSKVSPAGVHSYISQLSIGDGIKGKLAEYYEAQKKLEGFYERVQSEVENAVQFETDRLKPFEISDLGDGVPLSEPQVITATYNGQQVYVMAQNRGGDIVLSDDEGNKIMVGRENRGQVTDWKGLSIDKMINGYETNDGKFVKGYRQKVEKDIEDDIMFVLGRHNKNTIRDLKRGVTFESNDGMKVILDADPEEKVVSITDAVMVNGKVQVVEGVVPKAMKYEDVWGMMDEYYNSNSEGEPQNTKGEPQNTKEEEQTVIPSGEAEGTGAEADDIKSTVTTEVVETESAEDADVKDIEAAESRREEKVVQEKSEYDKVAERIINERLNDEVYNSDNLMRAHEKQIQEALKLGDEAEINGVLAQINKELPEGWMALYYDNKVSIEPYVTRKMVADRIQLEAEQAKAEEERLRKEAEEQAKMDEYARMAEEYEMAENQGKAVETTGSASGTEGASEGEPQNTMPSGKAEGTVVEKKKYATKHEKMLKEMGDEYNSLEEYVLRQMGGGKVKFRWKAKDSGTGGVGTHTTGEGARGDMMAKASMLDATNGTTPEEYAEYIYDTMPENLKAEYDMQDVSNEVINTLNSYNGFNQMVESAYEIHKNAIKKNDEAEMEREAELRDEWAQEKGFADYNDYDLSIKARKKQMEKAVLGKKKDVIQAVVNDWRMRVNADAERYNRSKTMNNLKQWYLDSESLKVAENALKDVDKYSEVEGWFGNSEGKPQNTMTSGKAEGTVNSDEANNTEAPKETYSVKVDGKGKKVYTITDADGKVRMSNFAEFAKLRKQGVEGVPSRAEVKALEDEYTVNKGKEKYPTLLDKESVDGAIEALDSQLSEGNLEEKDQKTISKQIEELKAISNAMGRLENPEFMMSDEEIEKNEIIGEATARIVGKAVAANGGNVHLLDETNEEIELAKASNGMFMMDSEGRLVSKSVDTPKNDEIESKNGNKNSVDRFLDAERNKNKYINVSSNKLYQNIINKDGEVDYEQTMELARRILTGETRENDVLASKGKGTRSLLGTAAEIISRRSISNVEGKIRSTRGEGKYVAQQEANKIIMKNLLNFAKQADILVEEKEGAYEESRWGRPELVLNGEVLTKNAPIAYKAESTVFISADGENVIKKTHAKGADSNNNTIADRLHNLMLFGSLFEDTAYELVGIKDAGNGHCELILKQNLINGTELSRVKHPTRGTIYTPSERKTILDKFMSSLGFERVAGSEVYSDGLLEIDDVRYNHENVIVDENGQLFVIDGFVREKVDYLGEILRSDVDFLDMAEFMKTSQGIVYGWQKGKDIYLTRDGLNSNTPVHEYTHLWAKAVMKKAPELWENIKNLLKDTSVWKEVMNDKNYQNIHDKEDEVASEVLSRMSGREHKKRMEAEYEKMREEAGDDIVKAAKVETLINRMKEALNKFWDWVGKNLFGIKKFGSADEVVDRTLYDLYNETDLESGESKKADEAVSDDAKQEIELKNKFKGQKTEDLLVSLVDKNGNINYEQAREIGRRVAEGETVVRTEEGREIVSNSGRISQAIQAILRGSDRALQQSGDTYQSSEGSTAERLIEGAAKELRAWYDGEDVSKVLTDGNGVIAKESSEADVYLSADGANVIKVVHSTEMHNNSLASYLRDIDSFNEAFPYTPYEVIGFTSKEIKGKRVVCPIISQPYIKGKTAKQWADSFVEHDYPFEEDDYADGAIQEWMEAKGFKYSDDYNCFENEDLIIEDLHNENVIVADDGTFDAIDANVRAKDDGWLRSYKYEDVESEEKDATDKKATEWKNNVTTEDLVLVEGYKEVGERFKNYRGTTIQRGKIGKLGGKEVNFPIGKTLSGDGYGQLFVHKDYATPEIKELINKAESALPTDFGYNCVMYRTDRPNHIRFDEAKGFDTEREPVVGRQITVDISGEQPTIIRDAIEKQIWHHKWMWVGNDYNRFDVKNSYEWSRYFANKLGANPNGHQEVYNEQLKKVGLPLDEPNIDTPQMSMQSLEDVFKEAAKQDFGSAGTSINSNKLPTGFALVDKVGGWKEGTTNLDMGGGRFDNATEMLSGKGVDSYVFDPFNRDAEHNKKVAEVAQKGVDTTICNNCLNVINTSGARSNVILQCAKALKPGGTSYFTVYEGNGSGVGKVSKNDCWQENRKTKDYVDEIKEHYADVTLKGKLIIAKDPITDDKVSVWNFDASGDEGVQFMIELTDEGNRELWEKSKYNDSDKIVLVKQFGGALTYGSDARRVAKELGLTVDDGQLGLNGKNVMDLEEKLGDGVKMVEYGDEGTEYADDVNAFDVNYTNKNARQVIEEHPESVRMRRIIVAAHANYVVDSNEEAKQELIDAVEDYSDWLQRIADGEVERKVTAGAKKIFEKEVAEAQAYIDGIEEGGMKAPHLGEKKAAKSKAKEKKAAEAEPQTETFDISKLTDATDVDLEDTKSIKEYVGKDVKLETEAFDYPQEKLGNKDSFEHVIASGNLNEGDRKEISKAVNAGDAIAIREAAVRMVNALYKSVDHPDFLLVPMPDKNGSTEVSNKLCKEISGLSRMRSCDALAVKDGKVVINDKDALYKAYDETGGVDNFMLVGNVIDDFDFYKSAYDSLGSAEILTFAEDFEGKTFKIGNNSVTLSLKDSERAEELSKSLPVRVDDGWEPWEHEWSKKVAVNTSSSSLKTKYPEIYRMAKKEGSVEDAFVLCNDLIKPELVSRMKLVAPDALVVYPHTKDMRQNKLACVYADALTLHGLEVDDTVVMTNKVNHTGASSLERLLARARFEGEISTTRPYIIVDDFVTSGAQIRDLKDYIEGKGGKVLLISALAAGRYGTYLAPRQEDLDKLKELGINDEQVKALGIAQSTANLTSGEVRRLIGIASRGAKQSGRGASQQVRSGSYSNNGIFGSGNETSDKTSEAEPGNNNGGNQREGRENGSEGLLNEAAYTGDFFSAPQSDAPQSLADRLGVGTFDETPISNRSVDIGDSEDVIEIARRLNADRSKEGKRRRRKGKMRTSEGEPQNTKGESMSAAPSVKAEGTVVETEANTSGTVVETEGNASGTETTAITETQKVGNAPTVEEELEALKDMIRGYGFDKIADKASLKRVSYEEWRELQNASWDEWNPNDTYSDSKKRWFNLLLNNELIREIQDYDKELEGITVNPNLPLETNDQLADNVGYVEMITKNAKNAERFNNIRLKMNELRRLVYGTLAKISEDALEGMDSPLDYAQFANKRNWGIEEVNKFEQMIPHSAIATYAINTPEEVGMLKRQLPEYRVNSIRKEFEDPTSAGVYLSDMKVAVVFPQKLRDRGDVLYKIAHENAHYAIDMLKIPYKDMQHVLEHIKKHHQGVFAEVDATAEEYNKPEEAVTYLLEDLISDYGLHAIMNCKLECPDQIVNDVINSIIDFWKNGRTEGYKDKVRARNDSRGAGASSTETRETQGDDLRNTKSASMGAGTQGYSGSSDKRMEEGKGLGASSEGALRKSLNDILGEGAEDDADDPRPMMPTLDEGEDLFSPSYIEKMDNYHAALREWKVRNRGREERRIEDVLYTGDASGDVRATGVEAIDAEDADEREAFYEKMNGAKIDVTMKGIKRMIKDEILERRRLIETSNWEDAVMVHNIKQKTTKEERQQIPYWLEDPDEAALQPERIKDILKEIRDWFDEVHAFMNEGGLFTRKEQENYISNYCTHIWDFENSEPKAVADMRNWIRTNSPYTKERIILTLKEGLERGLKPKYDDICDIMMEYGHYATEAVANRRLVDFLKRFRVDEMPILHSDDIKDSDYVRIDNNALDGLKVYKKMKPLLDVVFGKLHTSDNVPLQNIAHAYDVVSGVQKKINLSLSFFHHGALTETALSMMGAPKFGKALFKNMIWDAAMHGKLPAFINTDVTMDAVSHFVSLGATQDYAVKEVNGITADIRKFFTDRKIYGLREGAVMADWVNKGMDLVLWDWLHDGYKIYSYKKIADEIRLNARRNDWDQFKLENALDEAGQLVNDTFGGQHWDILGWSPNTVKWARRLLLSPDWTISTIRQALAPFGIGQIYNDDLFWKKWFKKDDVASVRKKYGRMFWLNAFLIFLPFYNMLNAYFRKKDEEEEFAKAEEMRKSDPNYKSMYELAYPNGMKWYDYIMPGNTLGQQTHMFVGRNKDGQEIYVRWGKQFRELPELFFGRDGFSIPGPLIDKMTGKLNPLLNTGVNVVSGYSLNGWENPYMKNTRGWEKEWGRLQTLVASFTPYSIPTDGEKQFIWSDLLMPSTKGFSAYKAKRNFETAILCGDLDLVGKTYEACMKNNLKADEIWKATVQMIESTARKDMIDGIEDVSGACKMFDSITDAKKRKQLANYIKKMLSAQDWKQIEKSEMLEKAEAVINGESQDVKVKEYEKLMNSNDVIEDWKMSKTITSLKPYYEEYMRIKKEESSEDAASYKVQYKSFLEKYESFNKAKNRIIKRKKKLGGDDDDKLMDEIREIRKNVLEEK